jgi:hypothetical protein
LDSGRKYFPSSAIWKIYNSYSGNASGVVTYVSSLNALAGDVILTGDGSTVTISESGQTLTFSVGHDGNLTTPGNITAVGRISGNSIVSNDFSGKYYGDGSNLTGNPTFDGITLTDNLIFTPGVFYITNSSNQGVYIDGAGYFVVRNISCVPSSDNSASLGLTTNRWSELHAVNIFGSSISGAFYGDGSNLTGIAGGGSPTWGSIGGTLSNQTDLETALNALQPVITASAGLLKTDGADISTAVAGTDYQVGIGNLLGIVKGDGGGNLVNAVAGTDFFDTSTPQLLSTTLVASSITPITDGTYALSSSLGGSITFQGGIVTAFSQAN